METSIIWCLVAMILTVSIAGCVAIKAMIKTIEALEDELEDLGNELDGLEELLIGKGALSAEDALSLCERGA